MPAMRNFALKWKYLSKQVKRCFQLSKYCRIAFVCESFCLCIFLDVIKRNIWVKERERVKEREIKKCFHADRYSNIELFIWSIFSFSERAFRSLLRELKAFFYVHIYTLLAFQQRNSSISLTYFVFMEFYSIVLSIYHIYFLEIFLTFFPSNFIADD